jgi:putative FmdB family regulatory protein
MPRYDYKCQLCGTIKEFTVGMSQLIIEANCLSCGGSVKFIRAFSPTRNFILKGDGWAKDSYNKQSKKEGE